MKYAISQVLSPKKRWILVLLIAVAGAASLAAKPLQQALAEQQAKERFGGDVEIIQRGEPLPYDITSHMMFNTESISRTAAGPATAKRGKVNATIVLKGVDNHYPLYGELK